MISSPSPEPSSGSAVPQGDKPTSDDELDQKTQGAASELLSLVAANTINGVIITDAEGLTEWVNRSFIRMSGYGLEELVGRKPGDVLQGPGTDTEAVGRIRKAIRSGVACEGTLLNHAKDGHPFQVHMKIDPVRDAQGKLLKFIAIETDVTEQVQQQQSLRDSEARLQFALEASGDGLWDYDPQLDLLYLSPESKSILGYHDDEIGHTSEGWQSRIHPEDLEQARRLFAQHLRREVSYYRQEYRVRAKDGSYKWILDRGRVLDWGPSGEPLRVIGTHTDITKQRAMEQRLRESEERLRAITDTALGVSLIACDLEGTITFFSRGAEKLLGYTSEEMEGIQTPGIFHDPQETEERGRELSALSGEKIEGFHVFTVLPDRDGSERREWTYICKDGTRKSVELTVNVSRDASGQIVAYLGTAVDITDRKQMETALRKSEQKFRGMFELSPVGMALNDLATGRFIDVNHSLLDSIGYSRDEFAALTYWDITPREYEPQEQEQLRSLHESGNYGPYEKEYIRRNGEHFAVLLHGMVLEGPDGKPMICSIVQDISEAKRIERELRDAVEAQRAAFALLDAAGRIGRIGHWELSVPEMEPYWSEVTCDIHDMPPSATITVEEALSYYSPEDTKKISDALKHVIATGEPFEVEVLLHSAKGRRCWVHIRGEAVRDETGRITSIRGVLQDIDERRRAAELLEERNRLLEAATAKAEAHARAKAEFLANMSHEIRTPLNAVIGMSELLGEANLGEREREFVNTIHNSGDALLGLINDILDFSKIESGQLDMEHIPLKLRECIESALDIVSGPAAKKKLELLYWLDPGAPPSILGDLTRLRQVFVNLLSNAIKFTNEGEVFVTLTIRPNEAGGLRLHVSVRDSGIGIPAERMDKLFQAFSQVDASTTRRYGGTGLGLAISQRLIEKMGGRIWAESEVGEGSTFHFEIPVQPVATPIPTSIERSAIRSLADLRILIVDDNATNRWILQMQAESWGMEPVIAASSPEALEMVQRGERFDVAILDVMMPVLDGYELAEKIRRLRSEHDLPILLLTSISDRGPRLADLGIAGLLTKPVKIAPLFNALRQVLGGVRAPFTHELEKDSSMLLGELSPMRILVAEDNAVNQRVTDLMLKRLGFQPAIVANGLEVLETLGKEKFDVVFLDVQMPEMDGLEAAKEICRTYPGDTKPWLIALTAHAVEGDKDDCLAAGMDDYVSKPVRSESLDAALRRAAEHKHEKDSHQR